MHGLNRQVFFQCCLAVRFDILNPPEAVIIIFVVLCHFPFALKQVGYQVFTTNFLLTKCTQKGVTGATYWPSLSCSTTWPFDDFNEETSEEMEGWMQLDFHPISSGSDLDTVSVWKKHPKGMWFNNQIGILLIIPLPRGVLAAGLKGFCALAFCVCSYERT